MLRQIRFELFKMSRRPRSYLGFAAFALICFFVTLGVAKGDLGFMPSHMAEGAGLSVYGSPANAEFLAWMVIGSPVAHAILIMFMPFFVSLVFGEILSGESAEGTLRTVLTRPITRANLFTSKVIASLVYSGALVLFLGIAAYLMGWITFGRGGLLAVSFLEKPMIAFYPQGQGLARLALSYGMTIVGVTTVGMVAFFISSWLNNSLGAIGGSIMLLFTSFIVGEIPYFKPAKDYLFSTQLLSGQKAFLDPIPWGEVRWAMMVLCAYCLVFFAASYLIFRRKDILT